jgi:NADH dehydrogenase
MSVDRCRKGQVVVLGAGFGGLEFCRRFRHPDAEILLIDRQNHHLFQPLLYQVATAGLSMPEVAEPIRSILAGRKDVTVVMDEVLKIRLSERKVVCAKWTFRYDHLVIALGAVTSYFGHDEWEEFAPGLKSLEDAMRIRRDVLLAFESAEVEPDKGRRQELMTIVVVGGGPTGVELAGAFAELTRVVLQRDFRNIDPAQTRIVLVEAMPDILGSFAKPLPELARRELERLGVEVRTGSKVQEIGPRVVRLEDETIRAANIVWGAGVMAHPFITRNLDVPRDRANRIEVNPDLSLPGFSEVFAVGDIVSLTDANGRRVPGVSPAAMQMGKHVAMVIKGEINGKENPSEDRPAFAYRDKGSMATIGRSAAVAMVGPFKFSGLFAWLLWLFVHLVFLIGFRNKAATLLHWFYSYVTYKRGARIIPRPRENAT